MCNQEEACSQLGALLYSLLGSLYNLEVVVHTFNPSARTVEAGGSLSSETQPGLHSKFQDSQGYTGIPRLEKQNKQKSSVHTWADS